MDTSASAALQKAILELEIKAETQKAEIRSHFYEVVESIKPINLLKSTVKEIGERPGIASAALGTSLAIGAGVLSKKMIVGKSGNIFRRMLGGVIEFAVANGIANNSDAIASKGIKLLKKLTK